MKRLYGWAPHRILCRGVDLLAGVLRALGIETDEEVACVAVSRKFVDGVVDPLMWSPATG